ncbi:hypothetical protein [Streptomyces ochraceiscleroticus]|uniref:Uncharacterized protein n=1 Tax=Streptomyces ochraceiscleroticus TaxID=47761 RepID=A0ABW1MGF8_9ACTN|nr:hypothetical protein [Streptomyces ochraceiscleroticus]
MARHAKERTAFDPTTQELNVQRLLNSPRRTLVERARSAWWAAEDWWCRHVTERELHRHLDGLRDAFRSQLPPEWETPEHDADMLRRLTERIAAHRDPNSP